MPILMWNFVWKHYDVQVLDPQKALVVISELVFQQDIAGAVNVTESWFLYYVWHAKPSVSSKGIVLAGRFSG